MMNLKEALKLLDEDMKQECVRPQPEHYRVLIHGCAKVGYYEKAFSLYNEYKSRHFEDNFGIFTDLFNSLALAPPETKNDALNNALMLRKDISAKHTLLPQPLYHT